MSFGIFGLIEFKNSINNTRKLAETMGTLLRKDGGGKGEISYLKDNNCILGMTRICHDGDYQRTQIAQNGELEALCLIHGEPPTHWQFWFIPARNRLMK